jgi:AcrR family transcriptional regulator
MATRPRKSTAKKPTITAREPRQPRGQTRVDAILDAASALIAEGGVGQVTMHALARRSGTSIGSLYHFFPDRDSVLDALRQRHSDATRDISRQLGAVPAKVWRELSTEVVVERLISPFVEYFERYADYLPLMGGRISEEDAADFIGLGRGVLNARLPGLSAQELDGYALMFHVIAAGSMYAGLRIDPGRIDFYHREIARALTAYLSAIEASIKPKKRGKVSS